MESFYRDVNEEEILLSSIFETCYILRVHHQNHFMLREVDIPEDNRPWLYPAYNVWLELDDLDDLQGCDIHNAYNETNKPDQFIRIRQF